MRRTFKTWLNTVFDFKHSFVSYLLVFVFGTIYFVSQCLISGYRSGSPLYMIIVLTPFMVIGGSLEEAGWRGILQPELEKKHSFATSTLFVSVIWWIWHFPLFFVTGTGQSLSNIFLFGIQLTAFSFALSTIKKVTDSVWLCVLFHSFTNALTNIFILRDSVPGHIVSAAILITVSFLVLAVQKKRKLSRN